VDVQCACEVLQLWTETPLRGTDRHTYGQTYRDRDRRTYKQTGRGRGRLKEAETFGKRQRDREAEREKQTDRESEEVSKFKEGDVCGSSVEACHPVVPSGIAVSGIYTYKNFIGNLELRSA